MPGGGPDELRDRVNCRHDLVQYTDIVAVFGGLDGLQTLEEAEAWIKQQVSAMKAPMPIDVYIKGDEYKGIVFTKFSAPDTATTAVALFNKKRLRCTGKTVSAKHDQRIHVQALSSFLFGLKKLPTTWE